ncbi:bacteriohemerythrin [Synechocystis sp. LKSZ1]|uniref:bacteriohemerythrin n=1 Tax=Synechocystis sp. LKSZ1 TaxID=3144951 RepID=UPI00336BF202
MHLDIAKWQSEYESGNSLVDEQHKGLFSLINALNNAMLEGQGKTLLKQTIQSLYDYTNVHFSTEEEYMRSHDYPGYQEHRQKHEDLKKRVLEFQEEFSHQTSQLTIHLSHFLTNWLIEHIQKEDLKMIQYCRQKEVAKVAAPRLEIAQWLPRYVTGFALIDNQHKSLFHAINALHYAMLSGQGTQLLQATLRALSDYVNIHFATEEEYMRRYQYPDLQDHHRKHQALKAQVEDFNQRAEQMERQGEQREKLQLVIEISYFLSQWLIDHIDQEDQKMIDFLKQKQSEDEALASLGQVV